MWIMPVSVGMDSYPLYMETIQRLEGKLKIDIQLKIVSWNRAFDDLVQSFKKGDPPDVFQLGTTWVQALAYMGYLATVPPSVPKRPALNLWMERCCRFRGERIAVPWQADVMMMIARRDILEAQKIPPEELKDWDSFLKTCRALQELKERSRSEFPVPLAMSVRPEVGTLHLYLSWLWSGGWSLERGFSRREKILDTEEFIATFEYLKKLLQTSGIARDLFGIHPYLLKDYFYFHGRYVFGFGSPWKVVLDQTGGKYSNDQRMLPVKLFPLPAGPAGSISWGGGSVFCVSSTSRYPQESWELVKAFTDDEFMGKFVPLTGAVPVFDGEFWDEYANNEELSTLRRQIENACSFSPHPLENSLERILAKGIGDYIWGIIHDDGNPRDQGMRRILRDTDQKISMLLESTWELN